MLPMTDLITVAPLCIGWYLADATQLEAEDVIGCSD